MSAVDEAQLGDGPTIGPLTPKQVRILDHGHHRVTNSRTCTCGQVWAHCTVHRLIETIAAVETLDVERLGWAVHIAIQHPEHVTCLHQRDDWPHKHVGKRVMVEYHRLAALEQKP